ncbi:hypothetical protein JB92DRAFT_426604 [Gautieria morchelliformis]|nr:hypothetical protein JB92DRAFT_426604 [Gautieria morchelliformis]
METGYPYPWMILRITLFHQSMLTNIKGEILNIEEVAISQASQSYVLLKGDLGVELESSGQQGPHGANLNLEHAEGDRPPVSVDHTTEIPHVPVGSSNVIEVDEPARSAEGSTIEPNPTPTLPALIPLASSREVTPVAPLDQSTLEHAEGDRPPVAVDPTTELPHVPVESGNVIEEVDETARSVEGSTIEPNPAPTLPALIPLASSREVTPVAPLDQSTLEHAEGDRPPVPIDHTTEIPHVPVESSNVIEVDEPARSVEGSIIEANPTPTLPALIPPASSREVTPVVPLDQSTLESEIQPSTPEEASAAVAAQKQDPVDDPAPTGPQEAGTSLVSPHISQQDEAGENIPSAFLGIVKGPLITRILVEKRQNVPETSVENDGESAALDGDTTPLTVTAVNSTDTPFDADTGRSDVPEVATTPRSELGVFTPTFDSRSEVSAASNEPIPSLSPRTDPASPIAGEFEVPALALSGALASATTPEVVAQSVPDAASDATSEASIEPVPPSSPVHDVTSVSTPTKDNSASQLPLFNPLNPSTHIIIGASQHDVIVSAQEAPAAEPYNPVNVVLKDTPSDIPGLESAIVETENERPSVHGGVTPRIPDTSLLPNEAEQGDVPNGTESKTPSPPSWAVPRKNDASSKEVSNQWDDAVHDLNIALVSNPRALERGEPERAERVASPSRVGEYFPSSERVPVQIVPLPKDDDESSSKPSDSLDVSGKTRTRLISTASSRLLPGGWTTDSPRAEGRASLEMAQGEFSPPIRPQDAEDTASKKSGLKCLLM